MLYKGFKITPKQESIQVIDIITDTQWELKQQYTTWK